MCKSILTAFAVTAAFALFTACSNNDPIDETDIDTATEDSDTVDTTVANDSYDGPATGLDDNYDEKPTEDDTMPTDTEEPDTVQTDDVVTDEVATDEVVTDDVVTDDIATDDMLPDTDTVVPCTAENCVYFSEYIEGTLSNKAIEVYNGSTAAIDPAKYRVRLFPNGAAGANQTLVLSACGTITTLAAGAMVKIANGLAGAALKDAATCTHGVTDYNGNDAMTLEYSANGTDGWTVVDQIGLVGSDPGTGWAVAGTTEATAEHTLLRKATVTTGVTDWALSAGTSTADSQWTVNAQDDFTNFGVR